MMRIDFFRTIAFCLVAVSPLGISQVYKYVDENGNVTYSDTPPADQQDLPPAELPDVFYQPAVDVPERSYDQTEEAAKIDVSINSPKQNDTILGTQSNFSVSASTSRKLSNGERARLIVNGSAHATGSSLSWTVTDLIRGEYVLGVEIIDRDGKTIASSAAVTVFVQRNIAR